jgi:hypothetical protein
VSLDKRCVPCGALVSAIMGECRREGCPHFPSTTKQREAQPLVVRCPGCDGDGVEPNTHGRRTCAVCGGTREIPADPTDEVCPTCKAIPGMNCRGVGVREIKGAGVYTHASRERRATRRAKRYMKGKK